MRPAVRLSVLVLLVVGICGLWAPSAGAHAYLVETDPGNGVTVDAAPQDVSIQFSEPISLSGPDAVAVVGDDGSRVDTAVSATDSIVTVSLADDLPDGVYLVTWRVASADTHTVSGSVQFGVGVPASPIANVDSGTPLGTTVTEFATKFVLYAGLVASVGVWAAGKSASRIALPHRLAVRCRIVGSSVVVLASVVQLIVHAGESGESVAVVATSGFGVVVWVRVAAVVAVSLPLPSAITAAAVAVVGWTVAWNGHGGAGTWWYSVSTTVHVVASTVWLGGIFCLLVAVTRRRDHRAEQVRQWSTVALVCSALVVLTGVVQGVVQVEFPAALVTTGYGLVLVVKVVAVASMLLIAWRVSGRAVGIRPTLVRVELAVSAVVLVCAGILSSIAPAAASFRPAETGTLAVGPYALSLSISPARTGSQQIAVRAVPDGGALTAQSISATLSSADSDISGIAVDFPVRATEPSGPGEVPVVVFHSSAVSVPAGGEWTLQLTVVADRLHQYAGSFVYDVH